MHGGTVSDLVLGPKYEDAKEIRWSKEDPSLRIGCSEGKALGRLGDLGVEIHCNLLGGPNGCRLARIGSGGRPFSKKEVRIGCRGAAGCSVMHSVYIRFPKKGHLPLLIPCSSA